VSVYTTLDGVIGPRVATNHGWSEFCDWVRFKGRWPAVLHLTEHGWSEDLVRLEYDLRLGLRSQPPDDDTLRVVANLLNVLKNRGNATVLTVTLGLVPA